LVAGADGGLVLGFVEDFCFPMDVYVVVRSG
jgi:hypothetical protein